MATTQTTGNAFRNVIKVRHRMTINDIFPTPPFRGARGKCLNLSHGVGVVA